MPDQSLYLCEACVVLRRGPHRIWFVSKVTGPQFGGQRGFLATVLPELHRLARCSLHIVSSLVSFGQGLGRQACFQTCSNSMNYIIFLQQIPSAFEA